MERRKAMKRRTAVSGLVAAVLSVVMVLALMPMTAVPANAAGENDAAAMQEKIDKLMDPAASDKKLKDDDSNPFGYDKGVPFRLYEDAELYQYTSDSNMGESFAKVYNWFKKSDPNGLLKDSNWDKTENLGIDKEQTYIDNKIDSHWCVEAVPIDMGYNSEPRKSGIAFIGLKQKGGQDSSTFDVDVWVYDTGSKKYSNVVSIGELSNIYTWNEKTETKMYQLRNFFTLTAGDYNNDKKDSIVAYGAFTNGPSLFELKMDADGKSAPDLYKTVSTADMLHEIYVDNYSRGVNFKSDSSANGYLKLGCSLETGDVNGDKIDDLVAVSYTQMPEDKYVNKLGDELVMPQLSVSMGKTGINGGDLLSRNKDTTIYAGSDYYQSKQSKDCNERLTVQTPTAVVANTELTNGNGIVLGGYEGYITRFKDTKELANVGRDRKTGSMLVYSVSDKGLKLQRACTTDIEKALTTNCNQKDRRTTFPKLPVAAVSIDGTCQSDKIFLGGSFYEIAMDKVNKVYTIPCFQHQFSTSDFGGDSIEEVYVDQMAVQSLGKLGGNYESLAFSIVGVTKTNDTFVNSPFNYSYRVGVAGPKVNPDTSVITGYYGTGEDKAQTIKMNMSGTDFDVLTAAQFWPGLGSPVMNHVMCPVDCTNNVDDGMLLRYNGSGKIFADPQILAVLQASPAFEQLDQEPGETEYSFDHTYSYSSEDSKTKSFGVGVVANVSTPYVEASARVGYTGETREWTEKETTKEVNLSFNAPHDSVIVYRTPIVYYSYDVWKADKKEWEDSGFAVSYVKPPEYEQLSVEAYNQFTDEYNKEGLERCKKKNVDPKKFTQLDKLDADKKYLDIEGEPTKYYQGGQTKDPAPDGYTVLDKNVHRLGYNGGSDSTELITGTSVTEGKEKNEGVSVDFEVTVGPEVFKAGVYGSFESLTGHATSETKESATGVLTSVNNLDERALKDKGYTAEQIEAHQFTWMPAKWDSGIKYSFAPKKFNDQTAPDPTVKSGDIVTRSIPVYGYTLSDVKQPYNLDKAKVTLDPVSFDYDGKAKEPNVKVTIGDKELKRGDYQVSYMADGKQVDNCIEPNSYAAVVSGDGGNIGSRTAYFMIVDKSLIDLSSAKMNLDFDEFAYDGKPKSPKPVVTYEGKTLKEGTDYDLEYSRATGGLIDKCVEPGDYNVIAEGKGKYSGAAAAHFRIATDEDPIDINDAEVVLSDKEFPYTGEVSKPEIKTIGGRVLEEGKDYTAEWSEPESKDPGEYTVTITGMDCYTGKTQAAYKIDDPVSIDGAKVVLMNDVLSYDGKVKKPAVLTIGGMELKEGEDYTIEWSDPDSVDPGEYSLTITGNVKYTGQTEATYKIIKANNNIKLKARKINVKRSVLKKVPIVMPIGKAIVVQNSVGNITYKIVKVEKKAAAAKFAVNNKTRKLTIKRGLKKGSYKVTFKVTAAGNDKYDQDTKNVTVPVTVK